MKNNLYFSFILLIFSSCSTTPDKMLLNSDISVKREQLLVQKAKEHPLLNIIFDGFQTDDKNSPHIPNPTQAQQDKFRTFNIVEKRHLLRALDYVRFVVNTPEFEQELLKKTMYLARADTGPLGSNKINDKADPRRIYTLVTNFQYKLHFRKVADPRAGIAAVGSLGLFSYNYPNPRNNGPKRSGYVGFPNHFNLDNKGYTSDTPYHAGVVLHEIMHNLGFSHHSGLSGDDVVAGVQHSFRYIAGEIVTPGTTLYTKYYKNLEEFRPFYEEMHKDMLVKDTYVTDIPLISTAEFHIHGEGEEVCVTHEDGSYEIIRL